MSNLLNLVLQITGFVHTRVEKTGHSVNRP